MVLWEIESEGKKKKKKKKIYIYIYIYIYINYLFVLLFFYYVIYLPYLHLQRGMEESASRFQEIKKKKKSSTRLELVASLTYCSIDSLVF